MKIQKNYIVAAVLWLIFIAFTVLVMKVDVQPIGPEGSLVGLAGLNQSINGNLPYNDTLHTITGITGYLALFLAACVGIVGFLQFVKKKSIMKVDPDIIAFCVYVVAVLVAYILFEKCVVNYRPLILDAAEGLEASYPSSHSLLAISFMGAIMVWLGGRMDKGVVRNVSLAVCFVIAAITVVGRLFSGVHWFTDIIGGVILGMAFVMTYYAVYKKVSK